MLRNCWSNARCRPSTDSPANSSRSPPPHGADGLQPANTPGDAAQRYTWINEHWLSPAASITYTTGLTLPEAAAALGTALNPGNTGPLTLTTTPTAWLRRIADWTVVIEPGERPRRLQPLLTALSRNGQAVHLHWSARGDAEFCHAAAGEVRTRFAAFTPSQVTGSRPHALDDLRADLPLPLPDQDAGRQAPALLALAHRLTGITLDPHLLDNDWTPATPPEQ